MLQVLSRLIKGYNFRFQPRSHAVDLVETLHVVLGMLDRLSSSGEEMAGWAQDAAGVLTFPLLCLSVRTAGVFNLPGDRFCLHSRGFQPCRGFIPACTAVLQRTTHSAALAGSTLTLEVPARPLPAPQSQAASK